MKWLKFFAAVAAIAGAAAVLYSWIKRREAENAALDAYLMGDEPEAYEPLVEKPAVDTMIADIESWKNLKADQYPVTISFAFPNTADARRFQELAASAGLSSGHDAVENIVDVLYRGPESDMDADQLARELAAAASETHGEYQGFHFDTL